MRKINAKKIIFPAIAALSFGVLSVGTTFALFTDKAETSISVKAGKIQYNSEVTGAVTYSAKGDANGTVLDEYGNKYSLLDRNTLTFENGGTATVTNSIITLDRVTPGDGIRFKFETENKSNVRSKYRFSVKTSEEGVLLASALDMKISNTTLNINKSFHGLKTYQTEWVENVAEGDLGDFSFDVYLPLTAGNAYQNLSTDIIINLEAVQANAVTTGEAKEDEISGFINDVNEVPFVQTEGYWILNKDINGGLSNDVVVPVSKKATLDLNGHTLIMDHRFGINGDFRIEDTSNNKSGILDLTAQDAGFLTSGEVPAKITLDSGDVRLLHHGVVLRAGSSFIQNGGKISGTNCVLFSQANNCSITLNDGEVKSTEGVAVYMMASQGAGYDDTQRYSFTMNGGSIIGATDGVNLHGSADVTLTGGSIQAQTYGISTNGDSSRNSALTLSGGKIEAGYLGIYCASCKQLNISGGEYIGNTACGIELRAGTLNITGNPIFESKNPDLIFIKQNDNGPTTKGVGFSVVQHTTELPITLNIAGGTFKGKCGLSVANPQSNTVTNMTSNITKGDFLGTTVGLMSIDSRLTITKVSGINAPIFPESVDIKLNGDSNATTFTRNDENHYDYHS